MSTFMTESGGAPPAEGGGKGSDGDEPSGARRERREPSSEDHWSVVLKKLAPQGYQKAPQWQQEIIEKVVKGMASRQKDTRGGKLSGLSREQMARTIDLSALGVSPEAAEAFRQAEADVSKTMRELPHPSGSAPMSSTATELTLEEKRTIERQNKVHFYVRGIQMEQLLEQDLEADLKALKDQVGAAVTDEQFAQVKAASMRSRLEKQIAIVQKRCNALTVKASEIGSDNALVRLNIDDLRKEKLLHREQLTRSKTKADKMDTDIAFLTHQAHQALDQREKVRGKFLMAQRDMMQEREQKLAVIAELVQRAGSLDDDWADRQAQIADADEARRRSAYGEGRRRREAYEGAEVRYGFLTAQARGWASEFERLQEFTKMEQAYDPDQKNKATGLVWREAGSRRPAEGQEITNEALAKALLRKLQFTHPEWREFGLSDTLRKKHFIKGESGTYYVPDEPDLADGDEDPAQKVIDEITARYAEKERANTSLLRYLSEQQAEVSGLTEQLGTMQARREELHALLGLGPTNTGVSCEELQAQAAEEELKCAGIEELLEDVCTRVTSSSRMLTSLVTPEDDPSSRPASAPQPLDTKCTVNTLEKWLADVESSLFDVYNVSTTLYGRLEGGEMSSAELPQVFQDWVSRDRGSKVPKVTVPEIHDALCLQAAQQRRGGELEEEDEENVGEDAKKEAERNRSPFQRTKVNKAQERQRIIEWARKRQPGAGKLGSNVAAQVKQAGDTSAAAPIRPSASAPTLRRNAGAPPAGSGCNLPAISEGSYGASGSKPSGPRPAFVASTGVLNTGLPAAPAHGSSGSLPPPPPAAGPPQPGRKPNGGKSSSGPGARLRAATGASSSAPGLSGASASAPKDLGTVIYLLGTQSNSMNARRFLDGGRNV